MDRFGEGEGVETKNNVHQKMVGSPKMLQKATISGVSAACQMMRDFGDQRDVSTWMESEHSVASNDLSGIQRRWHSYSHIIDVHLLTAAQQ